MENNNKQFDKKRFILGLIGGAIGFVIGYLLFNL